MVLPRRERVATRRIHVNDQGDAAGLKFELKHEQAKDLYTLIDILIDCFVYSRGIAILCAV